MQFLWKNLLFNSILEIICLNFQYSPIFLAHNGASHTDGWWDEINLLIIGSASRQKTPPVYESSGIAPNQEMTKALHW
jgi:hypothetical protein